MSEIPDGIFPCPHCGYDLPIGANFCKNCGADERYGWGENTTNYGDIPTGYSKDDDFDYQQALENIFGEPDRKKETLKVLGNWRTWVALAVILGMLGFGAFLR